MSCSYYFAKNKNCTKHRQHLKKVEIYRVTAVDVIKLVGVESSEMLLNNGERLSSAVADGINPARQANF